MNPLDTMTALFSGERVSHIDTFILAALALGAYIGLRTLRRKMTRKDKD